MKKLAFLLTLLLVAMLALSACAQETVEPEVSVPEVEEPEEPMEVTLPDLGGREVQVAIENQYLPFNFVLDGVAQGWDYDTITEICNRLNCTPVWVEFAWDTMIATVADGQFDMAADGITITEERAQSVDYSIPYIAFDQQLLVRVEEDRISSPQEFAEDANLILGEQIGTTNYAAAVDLVGEDRVVGFDTFPFAVQALIAGDVDGVVMDNIAGLGYQGASPDKVMLLPQTFQAPEQLGFIYPKGSDLVDPFDQALQSMMDDGTLAAINEKWWDPSFTIGYEDIDEIVYLGEETTVGTADNPVKVLFVPSVDASEIVTGGELLSQTLNEVTGLEFEVVVPTSYAATLEEMCASPDNTMGFIPGLGYVLANQLCGVDVSAKAERFGYDWYAAMFVVQRDSDFQTIEDLEGATWATPEFTSTSGYLYPTYLFQDLGITPGDTVESGGHTGAMRAVYNGEVDFATAFYSPYRVDGTSIDWLPGEDPEIPDDLVASCANTEDDGTIMCGNHEPRDARRNLRREVADAVQQLRIVGTTSQITNDTVSFGPDFPPELREAIMTALFDFVESDPDGFATALDHYSWTAVLPASDADYDDIRLAVGASGFTIEDLGG